jgi:hypothetical protein
LRPTWRVRERAEALGLTIEDVQFGARITGLQAEAFWNNTAKQVHIETLAKLGHILQTTNISDFLSLDSWDVEDDKKSALQKTLVLQPHLSGTLRHELWRDVHG